SRPAIFNNGTRRGVSAPTAAITRNRIAPSPAPFHAPDPIPLKIGPSAPPAHRAGTGFRRKRVTSARPMRLTGRDKGGIRRDGITAPRLPPPSLCTLSATESVPSRCTPERFFPPAGVHESGFRSLPLTLPRASGPDILRGPVRVPVRARAGARPNGGHARSVRAVHRVRQRSKPGNGRERRTGDNRPRQVRLGHGG